MNRFSLARVRPGCATSREGRIAQTVFAQLPGGRARSNTSIYYSAPLEKKC